MNWFLFVLKSVIVITCGEVVLQQLAIGIVAIIFGVKLIKNNKKSNAWNILYLLLIGVGVVCIGMAVLIAIVIFIFCYALT